jgi:hypothetical protein
MPPRVAGVNSSRDLFFYEDQAKRTCSLEPCPRCGGEDIWPELMIEPPFGLYCRTCQWGGPREGVDDDEPDPAMAAWDREAAKIREARALGLNVNLVQNPDDLLYGL